MNKQQQRLLGKSSMDIIEEATHLLRRMPASLYVSYYAGTLPFVLCFLFFWADMSRSSFAYKHAAEYSLLTALLFIWMKCWQAVFAGQIKAFITEEKGQKWNFRRILRLIASQSAIQPTGLILLPAASIVALPFGWAYAFYQNATVYGSGEMNDTKSVYKASLKQAMIFPRQNHMLISILFLFNIAVFINVIAVIYLLPNLLNTFFGIETVFTRAGFSMFNTTFLAIILCISYLLLDPLIKIVYVLRCFYGESLHTGEDLKVELRKFAPVLKIIAACVLVFSCLFVSIKAGSAAETGNVVYPVKPGAEMISNITPQEINRSIDKIINRSEYAWKMPREKYVKVEEAGFFDEFIAAVTDTMKKIFKPVLKWVKNALEWIAEQIEKLFKNKKQPEHNNYGWMSSIHILLYVVIAIVASALAIMLWRTWLKRKGRHIEKAVALETTDPDLSDENVAADDLPANRWILLANELMAQGNLRLALRAFYFASLALMSQKELLSVAKFKSNNEYVKELNRKAHSMPELLGAFSENIRIIESIWYGMHEVTEDIAGQFTENHKRITAYCEK